MPRLGRGKNKDYTGIKTERIEVIERTTVENQKQGQRWWLCIVEGEEVKLTSGQVKSLIEDRKPRRKDLLKKGKDPEYQAWYEMIRRCYNPKRSNYKWYGGKGIKVHQAWIDDFNTFYKYIGDRPSPKHTLDRIDTTKDYEPGNVEWTTHTVNCQHQNSTVLNPDLVRELRKEYEEGQSIKDIASNRNLNYVTVREAIHKRTWKNIE